MSVFFDIMVPIFMLLAKWDCDLHVYKRIYVDNSVKLDEEAMVLEQDSTRSSGV